VNLDFLTSLNFGVVWEYRWQLLAGFGMTLELLAVSAILGLCFGSVLAIASQSRHRPLRWLVIIYVEVWRNTPLLVQLFWIHFALPMLTGINTTALESGLIALTANVTAYFSEIVRAGIQSVDQGQWEAARALGLRPAIVWRKVILPQAFRIVLPPLVNMTVSLLKATAILSVLSINDLMRVAASLANYTFKPVELYSFVALVYFAAGLVLSTIGNRLERRMGKSVESAG